MNLRQGEVSLGVIGDAGGRYHPVHFVRGQGVNKGATEKVAARFPMLSNANCFPVAIPNQGDQKAPVRDGPELQRRESARRSVMPTHTTPSPYCCTYLRGGTGL